jgi:hypothetical protein
LTAEKKEEKGEGEPFFSLRPSLKEHVERTHANQFLRVFKGLE